jgi:hypothetical protein
MNDSPKRGDELPTAPPLPDVVNMPNACVACRFWGGNRFDVPTGDDLLAPLPPLNLHGRAPCRRIPPVVVAEGGSGDGGEWSTEGFTRWPRTGGKEWCGHFEPTDGADVVRQLDDVRRRLEPNYGE